eukprot:CAMPEP_0113306580 /NCGR_PEP_ID=MMETSP0010_2-20120614/5773_1 /TAXON_ID=216773 ORGANISM="Corethron hystrix, Strain 308" /NCGR_SAMPLE_ID=MMETSP0010_2 /ASSEMBLY_ACC=CAM_ASM_000155 /LENGTH=774 /DNA_ID=CAMNT_0000161273 /DNA_START=426 /DNA_END=2750 /DNA_ORIENTATION=+ /assembly_acc=CAM_ASM_000155
MRTHDHDGFLEAVAAAANTDDELVVPVFVIDPTMHLRSQSPSSLRRLHASLLSLEKDLMSISSSLLAPLVVRTGAASSVLPTLADEINASTCHVIADDVISTRRNVQRSTCNALIAMDVEVIRWDTSLRPSAPWTSIGENGIRKGNIPSFFPDYCAIADSLSIEEPKKHFFRGLVEDDNPMITAAAYPSEGIPSLEKLIKMAESETPDAVLKARSSRPTISTTEPYDDLVTRWSTEASARKALKEYVSVGKDEFADTHFIASDAANVGSAFIKFRPSQSMYASAMARVQKNNKPSDVFALREAPTRAFTPALSLGSISAREVVGAARNKSPVTPPQFFWEKKNRDNTNNRAQLFPSDDPFLGRSSEGSLSDVVEWREWFHLLAERSLELQEIGESGTSGGEKSMSGDPREQGTIHYWRWKEQHLVRYITWPAGKDYMEDNEEDRSPAMLLVHGFAASAEQWERLVHSLRKQGVDSAGKDKTPPIFAVDLLGFGHSEKPGLSYTQYLWESQIIDFSMEVMEAQPMVLVGNSIGGGLSAGAASSLGNDICRGVILCNTAGVLEDPSTYSGYDGGNYSGPGKSSIMTYTEAAMKGNPNEAPYSPVPIFGNNVLDLFGKVIIKTIYPQIEKRLSLIYGNRLENADPAVTYAIQQSAVGPGSDNVVGSGQKLSINRPLNEVLFSDNKDDGFPILVVVGLDDRVSSPAVAKTRAELFSRLKSEKVNVKIIEDGGHCPHDEVPEKVASIMLEWLPTSHKQVEDQEAKLKKTQFMEEEIMSS